MRFWALKDDGCGTNWQYLELTSKGTLVELSGVGLVTTDGVQDWYDTTTNQYHKSLKVAKLAVEAELGPSTHP